MLPDLKKCIQILENAPPALLRKGTQSERLYAQQVSDCASAKEGNLRDRLGEEDSWQDDPQTHDEHDQSPVVDCRPETQEEKFPAHTEALILEVQRRNPDNI